VWTRVLTSNLKGRRHERPTEHRVLRLGHFGWGELGCYGGGVPRGAPTPRIDEFAADSLSALLTGRHAIPSGTQSVAPASSGSTQR
jgi:hypothetical protein